MIKKDIIFFGKNVVLACDAKCSKAWGIDSRPRKFFSDPEEHPDDYVYEPDSSLGKAPSDPGSSEGFDGKPQSKSERLNKWCARQCERSIIVDRGQAIVLPDLEHPQPNMFSRRDPHGGTGGDNGIAL